MIALGEPIRLIGMGLLFDFCVEGIPLSQQASGSSKRRWKSKVHSAAAALWPIGTAPLALQLSVRVTYYHDGPTLDVDNMMKPILDALCGLVYADDAQISDSTARRRDINGSFRVRGVSPQLAVALARGAEFVHVEILEQPDQQDIR